MCSLGHHIASNAPIVQPGKSRKAIIIANTYETNNYQSHLPETKVDARDMKTTLQLVGFTVVLHVNLILKDMIKAIQRFTEQLDPSDEPLFYFSGHGFVIDGVQFLVPNDMRSLSRNDAKANIKAGYNILHAQCLFMKNVQASDKIFIMDCCRTCFNGRVFSTKTPAIFRCFERKSVYQSTIDAYKTLSHEPVARNLTCLFATNLSNESAADTSTSSSYMPSKYTKALLPLIQQRKTTSEIQEEMNVKVQQEGWEQIPMMISDKANYRF